VACALASSGPDQVITGLGGHGVAAVYDGAAAGPTVMFRAELDRIPEADGRARGRVFLRFAIIDTNFDGQAALFAQACAADGRICDRERMKEATQREVEARLVAPGNVMPLYFVGHPRLAGPQ